MAFIEKPANRWILFAILLGCNTINLFLHFNDILQSRGLSLLHSNSRNLLLFLSIGIQTMHLLVVLLLELLALFWLTKIIFKENKSIQTFFTPLFLSSIAEILMEILFNCFFKEFLLKNLFILSFLSPVTPLKVVLLFLLCKKLGIWTNTRKATLLCAVYLFLGYLISGLLHVLAL